VVKCHMGSGIMVKSVKSRRKQSEKAEAMASRSQDTERAEGMRSLAEAFRARAVALETNKKKGKTKS
jgi:hypothetical protein